MRRFAAVAALITTSSLAHAEPGIREGRTAEIALGVVSRTRPSGGLIAGGIGWFVNDEIAIGGRATAFIRDGAALARFVVAPDVQYWIHDRVFFAGGPGYASVFAENLHGSLNTAHGFSIDARVGTAFRDGPGRLTLVLEANYVLGAEVLGDGRYNDVGGLVIAAVFGYQHL